LQDALPVAAIVIDGVVWSFCRVCSASSLPSGEILMPPNSSKRVKASSGIGPAAGAAVGT
jgi:hypothetical protein